MVFAGGNFVAAVHTGNSGAASVAVAFARYVTLVSERESGNAVPLTVIVVGNAVFKSLRMHVEAVEAPAAKSDTLDRLAR